MNSSDTGKEEKVSLSSDEIRARYEKYNCISNDLPTHIFIPKVFNSIQQLDDVMKQLIFTYNRLSLMRSSGQLAFAESRRGIDLSSSNSSPVNDSVKVFKPTPSSSSLQELRRMKMMKMIIPAEEEEEEGEQREYNPWAVASVNESKAVKRERSPRAIDMFPPMEIDENSKQQQQNDGKGTHTATNNSNSNETSTTMKRNASSRDMEHEVLSPPSKVQVVKQVKGNNNNVDDERNGKNETIGIEKIPNRSEKLLQSYSETKLRLEREALDGLMTMIENITPSQPTYSQNLQAISNGIGLCTIDASHSNSDMQPTTAAYHDRSGHPSTTSSMISLPNINSTPKKASFDDTQHEQKMQTNNHQHHHHHHNHSLCPSSSPAKPYAMNITSPSSIASVMAASTGSFPSLSLATTQGNSSDTSSASSNAFHRLTSPISSTKDKRPFSNSVNGKSEDSDDGDYGSAESNSEQSNEMEGSSSNAPRKWTPEEDALLSKAVAQFGGKNWKAIASQVPGRNHVQCLQRWRKALDPNVIKGFWSIEEDNRLIEIVSSANFQNWGKVAVQIPGRTAKQCRERYYNHLDPSLSKEPWSEEEDKLVLKYQETMGNHWSEIARRLQGRSENQVKVRFKLLQRRSVKVQKNPLKPIVSATD